MEVFADREQRISQIGRLVEDVVAGEGNFGGIYAEVCGEVGLGVEVHQDDFFSQASQGSGEIDGGGGLADPAFLVGDGDDSHGF